MTKSQEIVERIIEIFPDFEKEWDDGEGFGYEKGKFTSHSIFLTFGPVAKELLDKSNEKQIKKFCELINELVEEGGDSENAVSTCFLEHASQLGVRKQIKRYLTKETQNELR